MLARNHLKLPVSTSILTILMLVICGYFIYLLVGMVFGQVSTNNTAESSVNVENLHDHFGILIDCGSSGSRVFVYWWPEHSGNSNDLLNIQPLKDDKGKPIIKKSEPGLSSFSDDPDKASDHLLPLLQFALHSISQTVRQRRGHDQSTKISESKVFILATAGLRMLSIEKQNALIADAVQDLPSATGLALSSQNIRVISGIAEGGFAWIALNYVLNDFVIQTDQENRIHTAGIADLGGGSLQLAFEVDTTSFHSSNPNNIDQFTVDDERPGSSPIKAVHLSKDSTKQVYNVFIKTWLGLGANAAIKRYTEKFHSAKKSVVQTHNATVPNYQIDDPCYPAKYSTVTSDSAGNTVTVRGTGSFHACRERMQEMYVKDILPELVGPLPPSETCHNLLCHVKIPGESGTIIRPPKEIYGVSEFYYTSYDVLGLVGEYQQRQFEESSVAFCFKNWNDILNNQKVYPNPTKSRLEAQCIKSAWLSVIIHDALGITASQTKLTTMLKLRNQEVHWSLGALLFNTRDATSSTLLSKSSAVLQTLSDHPARSNGGWLYSSLVFIVVLVALVLLSKLNCLSTFRCMRSLPGSSDCVRCWKACLWIITGRTGFTRFRVQDDLQFGRMQGNRLANINDFRRVQSAGLLSNSGDSFV